MTDHDADVIREFREIVSAKKSWVIIAASPKGEKMAEGIEIFFNQKNAPANAFQPAVIVINELGRAFMVCFADKTYMSAEELDAGMNAHAKRNGLPLPKAAADNPLAMFIFSSDTPKELLLWIDKHVASAALMTN